MTRNRQHPAALERLPGPKLLPSAIVCLALSLMAGPISAETEVAVFPDPARAGQELLVLVAYTAADCGQPVALTESFRNSDTVALNINDSTCPILPCCFTDLELPLEITPLPAGTYNFEVRLNDDVLLATTQVEILPTAADLRFNTGRFFYDEGETAYALIEGRFGEFIELGHIDINTTRAPDGLRLASVHIPIDVVALMDPPVPNPFFFLVELGPLPAGKYGLHTGIGDDGPLQASSFLEVRAPTPEPSTLNISPTNPTASDQLTALVFMPGRYVCEALNPTLNIEVEGNHVTVGVSGGCYEPHGDEVTPIAGTFGPLPAGTYSVDLIDSLGPLLDQTTITVDPAGGCVSNDTTLCLLRDRFEARVQWSTHFPPIGPGHVQTVTTGSNAGSGAFWFFDPANTELEVKVLNGCGVNGHYWVFAAGLTDVAVRLTIEDTVTDSTLYYFNEIDHPFEVIRDTEAFPCDSD